MRLLAATLLLVAAPLLAACSAPAPEDDLDPNDANGGGDADGDETCGPGHVARPQDGTCLAVGPQGCPPEFIDPESNLCIPRMDLCPKGTIPAFDQGCIPIGPEGCPPEFIDPESGFCAPRLEDCPPGSIPAFDLGCVPVGLTECHDDFFDPETGRCVPGSDWCGPFEVPVPAEGCVPLDGPSGCAAGPWGNVEALPGDVHVAPAASLDLADGSRDHPWPLLGHALGAVETGGRIVLAKGVHEAGLAISKEVALEGACASEVILGLEATTAFGAPTLLAFSGPGDFALRGVTLSGPGLGLAVFGGARVVVERVLVQSAVGAGVLVEDPGTEANFDLAVVRDTEGGGVLRGEGLVVLEGATVSVGRAALSRNRRLGIGVEGSGTVVDIASVIVEDTRGGEEDGLFGLGLAVGSGASAIVSEAVFARNRASGIQATLGGEITVESVLVDDTRGDEATMTSGYGVAAATGARVTLAGAAILSSRSAGLEVWDEGTVLEASRLLVWGTLGQDADGLGGFGVRAAGGAHVVLDAAVIAESHTRGVSIAGAGTGFEGTRLVVEATSSSVATGLEGSGLVALEGAEAAIGGGVLRANRWFGLRALGVGTSVGLDRVLVIDTLPDESDGAGGVGVGVVSGAAVTLGQGVVSGSRNAGLAVFEGSTASIEEVLVSGTLSDSRDGSGGTGLLIGGSLVATRVAVIGSEGIGLGALDAGAEVLAGQLLVEHSGSFGLASLYGADLAVDATAVLASRGWGVFSIGAGSTFDGSELVVAGSLPKDNGLYGFGIWAQESSLSLSASAVLGSHVAAVAALRGEASLSGLLLDTTTPGSTPTLGSLADGLVASEAVLDASDVVSRRHARAGFLFDRTVGSAAGLASVENAVGLALQKSDELAFPTAPFLSGNAADSPSSALPVDTEPIDVPIPKFDR